MPKKGINGVESPLIKSNSKPKGGVNLGNGDVVSGYSSKSNGQQSALPPVKHKPAGLGAPKSNKPDGPETRKKSSYGQKP